MRYSKTTLAVPNIYAILTALNGSVVPIIISLGGLAGAFILTDDKTWATLPVSGFNVGVALMAAPAALLMQKIGRRGGFQFGSVLGLVGIITGAFALERGSFIFFCLGLFIVGTANSFVQQYRFAASDYVASEFRSKAISRVLVGGIFAAIIGPQIVLNFQDTMYPTPFVGAFYGGACVLVVGFFVMRFLPAQEPAVQLKHGIYEGRSRREFLKTPAFWVPLLCGASTYGLMALVMTAAPLAIVGCGFEVSNAAIGIQWHVLSMFVPSLITGSLIARFGSPIIITVGLVLLMSCSLLALSGVDLFHFYGSLILLGLGWNFGFIGSTALLTKAYYDDERHVAQGLNDSILFGVVAISSLLSGILYHWVGWAILNWFSFPIAGLCLCSLTYLVSHQQSAESLSEREG